MSAAESLPKSTRLPHQHESDLKFYWGQSFSAMGIGSNCLNDMRMKSMKNGKGPRAIPIRTKAEEWAKEDYELEMDCRWGGKNWKSSNEGPGDDDPYPESHVRAAGRFSRVDRVLRHMMAVGNDGDVTLLYQLYGVARENSQLGVFGDLAPLVAATPTAARLRMKARGDIADVVSASSYRRSAELAVEAAIKKGDGHVWRDAIRKEADKLCRMACEAYLASWEVVR